MKSNMKKKLWGKKLPRDSGCCYLDATSWILQLHQDRKKLEGLKGLRS